MTLTNAWTGRTACALQSALRLSNEGFAAHLGVAPRTVAAWHQKLALRPKSEMQQLLDTALAQASADAQERFAQLADVSSANSPSDAERRLIADPTLGAILEWLDNSAGWQPGTARRKVAERLARMDVLDLHDRGARRGRVDQHQIAHALREYYGTGTYGAQLDREGSAVTSVLTTADWVDLECPLTPENDRLSVVDGLLLLATVGLLKSGQDASHRVRLAVWLSFLLGIAVSLAANIAAAPTLAWLPILVAGWPPVALLLAAELLTHHPQPREHGETEPAASTEAPDHETGNEIEPAVSP